MKKKARYKKNNDLTLWVLGWIFCFPIPLSILILRNKNLSGFVKIIAIILSWVFFITVISRCYSETQKNSIKSSIRSNIVLVEGQESDEEYFYIKIKNVNNIHISDFLLISDNPEVATITFSGKSRSTYIGYYINGITPGTAQIYASSKDGSLISEKINVTVLPHGENIKDLHFLRNGELTIKEGQSTSESWVQAEVYDKTKVTFDDLVFISANPEIAVIKPTKTVLSDYVYYYIEGISSGSTEIYVTSLNGIVSTEKIKVNVLPVVKAKKITINEPLYYMVPGEKYKLNAQVYPDNSEDKTITWTSSDESVIVIKENTMTAISGGTSNITASTSNGISSSFTVDVDGTKRSMWLYVSRSRQDKNNIGHEWIYQDELNGAIANGRFTIAVGDTLTCKSRYTENDSYLDVGEASSIHYVTEDDMKNGFTIPMELFVTENNGSKAGLSAHFLINYRFMP